MSDSIDRPDLVELFTPRVRFPDCRPDLVPFFVMPRELPDEPQERMVWHAVAEHLVRAYRDLWVRLDRRGLWAARQERDGDGEHLVDLNVAATRGLAARANRHWMECLVLVDRLANEPRGQPLPRPVVATLLVDQRHGIVIFRGRQVATEGPDNLDPQALDFLTVTTLHAGEYLEMKVVYEEMAAYSGSIDPERPPSRKDLLKRVRTPFCRQLGMTPTAYKRLFESVGPTGVRLNLERNEVEVVTRLRILARRTSNAGL